MTRRTCVFCGDELTRRSKREHVLPEWFTKRWNAGEDGREFCFEINGDLVRRTDGKVHTHSTFPRSSSTCVSQAAVNAAAASAPLRAARPDL